MTNYVNAMTVWIRVDIQYMQTIYLLRKDFTSRVLL